MPPTFYYDVNSPYAYLAANRIGDLIPDAVWRPILFGAILKRDNRIPWSVQPDREVGMEEVERRASERGLPPVRWPDGWPLETYSLPAQRALVVAEERGALVPASLEIYRSAFVDGVSMGELENVVAAVARAGLDADDVRAGIERQEVKDRLRAYTDEAIERGVQGVPTVAVGDSVFWGDDRLEDAAAAAAG